MAASDYVPIFFKNRLHLEGRPQMHLEGRPQMSMRPSSALPYDACPVQSGAGKTWALSGA
jgi:hypothetical protein